MEVLAAVLGLSLAAWILIAIVAGIAFPLFWIWMVADAILREQADYPSGDSAEKIMWIVLMLVIQVVAAVYFFLVWLPKRRERTAAAVATPSSSVAAGPATS